ncbi:pantothenate kinase [Toxoplasma gondii p89]|nr:pantothenate kinase [Toxoplasma gondii FOU]KFG37258.1 pantothenate kinase [Toxoplasma gondii p89]RQX70222.1 pantothenate kinase [Toxoplasma gondii CAST]
MGLCRLILPGELSPKNLLELAATGDNRVCDMLVRDIYGGSYDAIGLKSSTIASTFGKLQHIPVKYLKEYSLSTARESEEAEASRGDAKRGAQTAASQAENKGFLSPSTSCSSLCEARQSRASSSSTGRSPVSCLTQATSRGSVISPPGKEARCFSSAARRTLPVEQRREEAREAETQSEGEGEGLRTQGKARGEVSCEARAAARRSGENSRERHVRTSRSSQPCRGRSREGMVEAPTDGAAGEKRKGDEEDFENEDRPRGGDGERQDEREEEREEAAGVPQVERAADGSLRQREKNAGDTVADRGMHLCRFETVLESARDTGVSRWEGTRPRAMPSCSECDCCMPCEEWEQTWEDDSWSSSVLEDEEWGEEGLSDATEDEAEEEPCSASSLCSACRWPSLEESVEQEKRGRGAERKACERNGEASAVEKVPGRFASCDAGKDRKDVETMHGEKRGDKVRDGLVYRRPTGPDIVRSLLTLMSFNVAQQAYLHATLHGLTRIALVGFLLDVPAFLASLQHSVRFWSKNRVKVFFCSLSPFLGALGASLAHARFLFASRGGHSGVCGEASASPSSLPVSELLAGKSKSEKSPSYLSTSCSASTRTSSPFYPSSEYRACFSPAKREVSALLSRTPSCFSSPFSSSAFAASWASRDVCTAPSSAHPAAGPAGARLPAEQQREAREREEVQTRRTARRVDSSACLSRACRRASSAPVRARGEETDEGEDEDVAESTASHFDRRAAPAVGLPYLSPQAAFTSPSSYSSSAALSSSSSTLLVPLQCGADTPCYETDGRGGESSFSAHRSSFSSLLHAVGGANEGTLSSAASPRWSIEAFPSPQGLPPLLRSPQPPFSPSTPTSFVPQDAPFPPVSPRPVPSFFPAVSPKARPTSGGASATLHSSPYALPFDAIAEEPQEETHAASPLLLPQPLLPPPPPFLPPLASCFHVLPAREESE